MTSEREKLQESRERSVYWKKWGPYVSERPGANHQTGWTGLVANLLMRSSQGKVQTLLQANPQMPGKQG